jgi:hypothetical protein
VVSELVKENGAGPITGMRRSERGRQKAVDTTAEHLAGLVDDLLGKRWDRRRGEFHERKHGRDRKRSPRTGQATCACGSGIPIQKLTGDR